MTERSWLISHFCAALLGFLLAVFFFSGTPPEKPSEHATRQLEIEIQELEARLLSYQELRLRLEERIAYLLIKPANEQGPTEEGDKPPDPDPDPEPDPTPTPTTEDTEAVSLAFDEAVALANFQGMADEIFDLVRRGEFDSAVATIRYLEWLMETDGNLNPIARIRPLYRQASARWMLHLMATLNSEPDMMVRFALALRKKQRAGQEIGNFAAVLGQGEIVQLALSTTQPVAYQTQQAWVQELVDEVKRGRPLEDSEVASLGQISGPEAVKALSLAWRWEKNRESVISALVQHQSPESRRLLQQLIFEISDRDLRGALELWLNR